MSALKWSKLQIGCLIIVLFVVAIYYGQYYKYQKKRRFTLFDVLIMTGIFTLVMDGVTAYTVNHLETVSHTVNLILHALFLIGLDSVVFVMFLYMLSSAGSFPRSKKARALMFLPYALNVTTVLLGIGSLHFIRGRTSNYSMGLSAYTCFVMVGIYTLLTVFVVFKRRNYIEKTKKVSIFIYLAVQVLVTAYQIAVPQSLITSIATTALILAVYLNQEDPALSQLSHYHNEMVMGFATLIENRDESTGEHVRRTTAYVRLLAEKLKQDGCYAEILTKDYLNNLYMAAPLHDIGKIAVPDAVLQKPGRLTPEEFEQIKTHSVRGGQIIRETFGQVGNEKYLQVAYQVARFHHEKWNGKGYPDGLKENEIPLCARIMAIADVFDAVSEKRCYRDAMPIEECFGIIESGRGESFEPLLTDAFLSLRDEIEKVRSNGLQQAQSAVVKQ